MINLFLIGLGLATCVLGAKLDGKSAKSGAEAELANMQEQIKEAAARLGPGSKVSAELHWIDNPIRRTDYNGSFNPGIRINRWSQQ